MNIEIFCSVVTMNSVHAKLTNCLNFKVYLYFAEDDVIHKSDDNEQVNAKTANDVQHPMRYTSDSKF